LQAVSLQPHGLCFLQDPADTLLGQMVFPAEQRNTFACGMVAIGQTQGICNCKKFF